MFPISFRLPRSSLRETVEYSSSGISVRRITLVLLVCLTHLNLFGAKIVWADVEVDKLCPEAALEHAQLLSKRHAPKDATTVTRPALRKELLQMEQRDQDVRDRLIAAFEKGDPPDDDPTRIDTRRVDTFNLRRLKHIVHQDGFPTTAMVGVDGVHAAFLLTQHADDDPAFQQMILNIIAQRWHSGVFDSNPYALLTDRVLRAHGQPQRYGTQFEERDGDWKPEPIADEAHVDERRRAIGLMSLANYSCRIRAVYGPAHSSPGK
jgi:hypothetical protein